MISVLVESGCRVGELISMQTRHVRFADEFVWLTFTKSKTKSRTLPLKKSMTYLANWLSPHPFKDNESATLWVSLNPIPTKHGRKDQAYQSMSRSTVLSLIHRIADKAGIKKRCYTHLFRHNAATKLSTM
jgi:integrase/recombinase XerD